MSDEKDERTVSTTAPPRGRVLGIDLGERFIGIAVSDTNRRQAFGREVLERSGNVEADRVELARLVAENEATLVVIGLPRSLSGALGPAARGVLAEVAILKDQLNVPIETIDERFSTREVIERRPSRRPSVRRAERKTRVDHLAAEVFLQAYLDKTAPRT